jgi:flagellar M-ring protein FliF
MAALTQIRDIWNRMPASGRITTVVAALATIGLLGALVYYGSQPDYGVLFSDLKPADAQSIVEKLKTSNVPYSISNGGTTVLVPNERIAELRLQMASEGMLSGGHVGFDLFDKTSFGATDFVQQMNFRRAIEGELAKTLEGLDEIESARVHITPKKESIFTEKEEGAKATVMVRVKQNKQLSAERADAVVSLLSSAVEGLDPASVSVIDGSGRLIVAAGRGNTAGGAGEAGAFHAQLEAKQKFETENAARIIALLEPVVGENRVRADIAADIDFSQVEQSEEKYNPQSQVVRSQQTSSEARNTATANPAGIAGARSNNPATQPSPAPAPAPATPPATGDQRSTSTVNYEIDKTVKKTIGGGGRVNRMSVSVVVDNKVVNDVEVARTPEEIKQIQDLVGAAVGIDTNRGDSVVVQTMAFSKPPTAENGAAASFLERNKPLVSSLTKYGALVIVAFLILLFVIRPARKALKAASSAPAQIEGEQLLLEGEVMPERRRTDRNEPYEIDENSRPMMTVAELEAQMGSGDTPVNQGRERAESIRKQIAEKTISDTETVAGTLRGWLREGA